jgi:hypothetical protein
MNYDIKLQTTAANGVRRAKLNLLPGDGGPGILIARAGANDSAAIARALRGLADQLEADARAARRAADGTVWVRLSVDVDVNVPTSEVTRAEALEKRATNGDMEAAQSIMDTALSWLGTAMHDPESRNWQSFDWAHVEECATDDFPEA